MSKKRTSGKRMINFDPINNKTYQIFLVLIFVTIVLSVPSLYERVVDLGGLCIIAALKEATGILKR